tara:strand:- start:45 stop:302 length:258 start_codon:yes stop_codon:yes gene_type:complete
MESFTQFCIWFLFAAVVVELGWKGWKKYNKEDLDLDLDLDEVNKVNKVNKEELTLSPSCSEDKETIRRSKRNKDKLLEEENKNKH